MYEQFKFKIMKKRELINQEIKKHEKEIERLKLLIHGVSGSTLEVCPNCKTKNRHWYVNSGWCCAYC